MASLKEDPTKRQEVNNLDLSEKQESHLPLGVSGLVFVFLAFIFPLTYFPYSIEPGVSSRFLALALFLIIATLINAIALKKAKSLTSYSPLKSKLCLSVIAVWITHCIALRLSINLGDAICTLANYTVAFLFLFLITTWICVNQKMLRTIMMGINVSLFIFIAFAIPDIFLKGRFLFDVNSITSILGNKNFFAETLMLSLPFLLYSAWTEKSWVRIICCCTIILSVVLIIILQSLSVLTAIIIGTIVYFTGRILTQKYHSSNPFFSRKKSITAILTVVIIFIVGVFAFNTENAAPLKTKAHILINYFQHPELIEETTSLNNNSSYERLLMIKNSLAMNRAHHWTGADADNWKIEVAKYGIGGTSFLNFGIMHYEHPHNEFLLLLTEQGIIGLLAFLSMLVISFYYGIRILKKSNDRSTQTLMLLMLAGVSAFSVDALFAYPASLFYPFILFILMLGIINSTYVKLFHQPTNTPSNNTVSFYWGAFILSLFSFFIIAKRFNGEGHLFKVLVAQHRTKWQEMISESLKAESWFYSVDNSGTPLKWYEGLGFFYQGDLNTAAEQFRLAEAHNPYHIQLLNDIGSGYEKQGDHFTAIQYFNRALSINNYYPDALLNASAAFYNMNLPDSSYRLLLRHPPYDRSGKYKHDLNFVLQALALKNETILKDSAMQNVLSASMKNSDWLYGIHLSSQKNKRSFAEELEGKLLDSLERK